MSDPVKRDVCPVCGIDAGSGPMAHTTREGCVSALRSMHLEYRSHVGGFVLNRLQEKKNHIGGVIGYTLTLDAQETERLVRLIEG